MRTPRNGEAPGAETGGNPQDQQGHADGLILPFGTEGFCGSHEQPRFVCGCKYEGPVRPRWRACLDCDASTRNQVRRCDRCLDALIYGLRLRADALARMAPLDDEAGGGAR